MSGVSILFIILGNVVLLFLLTAFFYKGFFKRFWDIILSFLAIIVLSPLFIVLSIIVRLQMGKPVLFSQDRIGRNGNLFQEHKGLTAYNSFENKELKVA